MATIKRDGKWYIKGRIQKEDGTYYQYTKLARGCKYVDEAREYETEFVKRWQAIQVAKYNKTFAELAEEYLAQAVNVKACLLYTSRFASAAVHTGKRWICAQTIYGKGKPLKLLQWYSAAVFPVCCPGCLFPCILTSSDAAVCGWRVSFLHLVSGRNVCALDQTKGRKVEA